MDIFGWVSPDLLPLNPIYGKLVLGTARPLDLMKTVIRKRQVSVDMNGRLGDDLPTKGSARVTATWVEQSFH